MPANVGPVELMCIYLLPALLIGGAILWGARMISKRKDGA
jgi:hypothetical protein